MHVGNVTWMLDTELIYSTLKAEMLKVSSAPYLHKHVSNMAAWPQGLCSKKLNGRIITFGGGGGQKGFYMTGGLFSEGQIYRNIGPPSS